MSFGIGLACLGAAACFPLPAYYVNPQVGAGFVLVAFTIVVLGGMGSFAGALLGDHGLAGVGGNPLRHRARQQVRDSTGRRRHNDADRLGGKGLRGRSGAQHGDSRTEGGDKTERSIHGVSPTADRFLSGQP